MRLSRYFMILSVVTCLGICYSHQQFILVKANYDMQFHKNRLSQLLDRNEKLMYNVATLESPANLEEKLKNNGIDYDVARRWVVVERFKSKPPYEFSGVAKWRNAVFKKFLNFIAVRAEARTIEN